MRVPFLGLDIQYAALEAEISSRLNAVLKSGHFILGPQVAELEESLAGYLRVSHAVGVASGSDALLLSMMALGISPGDEVITTTYSFFATASCITRTGATPVFCDIDPETFNLTVSGVKECLSPKTKAVIPVHLYGQPCDMDGLRELCAERNIPIVEDCAQAIGADFKRKKAGSLGAVSCFSFYPTKNLGAYGDGGCLATNSDELASKLRMLRKHGAEKKYFHDQVGINSRLDEMQAAVLNAKLPHLDDWNRRRQQIASRYRQGLTNCVLPEEKPDRTHVYHMFVIRCENRDTVRQKLSEAGIDTMVYYPKTLHEQVCFSELGYKTGDLPHAEKACLENIALPIYPEMTDEQADHVISSFNSVAGG